MAVIYCGEIRQYDFCKKYWDSYLPEDADIFFNAYINDKFHGAALGENVHFLKNTTFQKTLGDHLAPGFISYYRSISKAYRYILEYQLENSVRYENLMICRPDLVLGESIDKYLNKYKIIVPWIMRPEQGKIHDHMFIGPCNLIGKVSEIFEDMFMYIERGQKLRTHHLLFNHFEEHRIPYSVEPIIYFVMRDKYPRTNYLDIEKFILSNAQSKRSELHIRYMDEIIKNYIENNSNSETRGSLIK